MVLRRVEDLTPVGRAAHDRAVDRLRASYAQLPAGAPVRLAKPTTNLFRVRTGSRGPGLDISGLGGVVRVDPGARTADVQGMCTYETLVDATLRHGLVPLVVPQLRTITLGGAVAGLGIESTSFRNGLPHESVREMDVLTGAGEVVTTRPGEDLFDAFPNSYGSLGYATRLLVDLEPVPGHVALRHLPVGSAEALAELIDRVVEHGEHEGERVDAVDGVVFAPDEAYLTLARWVEPDPRRPPSDYTRQRIYYRSLRERRTDRLTMLDYLWRWDTDWFWCSGAFGAQHPVVRRLWPRRWRRSTPTCGCSPWTGASASPTAWTPGPGAPGASAWCRTSRCRWPGCPSSCGASTTRWACGRCGSAPCAPAAPGPPSRCGRARPT